MLAVAAFLGGALPDGDLRPTPVKIWQGTNGPLIIGLWLFGTVAMAVAWWVLRDRVPSVRWALVTAGLWVLPFLVTPPLGSRDAYAYACQGPATPTASARTSMASPPCPAPGWTPCRTSGETPRPRTGRCSW
ncbi:hypothetical protein Jiend_44490 [Micromonospora endophytica]|nr:hypothetical protein Jiend_44490 [Micromonospora endophytica]